MIGCTATATAVIWPTATCKIATLQPVAFVRLWKSGLQRREKHVEAAGLLAPETNRSSSCDGASARNIIMLDQFTLADAAAQLILQRTALRPQIALVLGSGLGGFADSLTDAVRVPYAEIPSFPRSTAIGHAGQMVIGKAGSVPVAAMQGRVHLYEGYSPQEITFPIRVFGRMGVRAVILTNAAGGINLSYSQGALVVIRDHINLQGANPLVGPNDDRFGVRFPDMTHAYAKEYRQIAREEAGRLGIPQHEGIYAGLLGPSYETPAEIEYLRRIGADLVGMSTVAEVIAARHMGIKVLAISCVTNMAAGILDQPLSHAEVMETGERVKTTFEALLRAVLPRIAKDIA
jgi:purine-nucleoside phosphorylase